VNGICSCGLPAHCCQLAVAGSIYANLRGELNSHMALQSLFTQSSPVHEPLLQAFPFPSTLGEVTLHLHSQACMFVHSSYGRWVFPHLLWSFPLSATLTSFPAPGCWAHAPAPVGASPAGPGVFIYSSGKDSLPPIFGAQCAPPSFSHVSLLFLLLITQFLFYPRVEVGLSKGLFCSGPGLSVEVPRTT
jgi:hypothetical protein